MPPNNFPPLYSIYIRIYGIKALGPSRRRLGTPRREGWALVVGEGWALVVGEGSKRCWCYRSRTETDKPPGFDLPIILHPLVPPSLPRGDGGTPPTITASALVVSQKMNYNKDAKT